MNGAVETNGWRVDWSAAQHPQSPGQPSGDAYVICPFPERRPETVLVVGIDGSGHGPLAARAAALAEGAVVACDDAEPKEVLEHCHRQLAGTRGAAVTAARLDFARRRLTWLGVGNVEAVMVGGGVTEPVRVRLPIPGGVVGYQIPKLRQSVALLPPAGLLVMATDGVASGFAGEVAAGSTPGPLAQGLLRRHSRGNDDALVGVVRWSTEA